jgi:hypothetical protein
MTETPQTKALLKALHAAQDAALDLFDPKLTRSQQSAEWRGVCHLGQELWRRLKKARSSEQ